MSYAPLDERLNKKYAGLGSRPLHLPFDRDGGGDLDSANIDTSSSHSTANHHLSSALSEPLTSAADHAASDPYYVFRDDLYRKLDQVDEAVVEYLRVVHQTDTSVNCHEFKESKKQLKRWLKSAESTLRDLSRAVQMVEQHRDTFSHVNPDELYQRQTVVQTSRDRLARAKQETQTEAVKAKLVADERARLLRRAAVPPSGLLPVNGNHHGSNGLLGTRNIDAELGNGNSDYIVDSQARTNLLVQHQEETLDELGEAVTRVGYMANQIHEEIGQQNKILTEMEDDLAHAEEELGMVMGKLAKFMKTKDRWQLGTILTLFLVMIVLLFLVIYV